MAETTGARKPYTTRLPTDIATRIDFLTDAERRSTSQMLEILVTEALARRDAIAEHLDEKRRVDAEYAALDADPHADF